MIDNGLRDTDTSPTTSNLLNLPNTGLRFLYDEERAQNSAQILLQWCIDPELKEYLLREKVRNPMIFIVVINPAGREQRYLVPFSNTEQFLQFRRSGEHTIKGRVVWGRGQSARMLRSNFLGKTNRHDYIHSVDWLLEDYWDGIGLAEITIDVPDGFFADEISPWESWWLGLWLGPLHDECSLRRRRAFAWFVQAPLVAIFIVVISAVRFLIATWFTVFLLERGILWKAVLHPFGYETRAIWSNLARSWDEYRSISDRTVGSRIIYADSNGTDRPEYMMFLFLFFPPLHLILYVVAFMYTALSTDKSLPFVEVFWAAQWLYFYFAVGMVILAIALVALAWVADLTYKWWKNAKIARLSTTQGASVASPIAKWFAPAVEKVVGTIGSFFGNTIDAVDAHLERRAEERSTKMYAQFQCDVAPATGIRPIASAPVGVKGTVRMAYNRAKAKVCRPFEYD